MGSTSGTSKSPLGKGGDMRLIFKITPDFAAIENEISYLPNRPNRNLSPAKRLMVFGRGDVQICHGETLADRSGGFSAALLVGVVEVCVGQIDRCLLNGASTKGESTAWGPNLAGHPTIWVERTSRPRLGTPSRILPRSQAETRRPKRMTLSSLTLSATSSVSFFCL